MLCTSGFMDEVTFARKPRLLDVAAQLKRMQCTRSLRLGYKLCAVIPVAGQRTHETTFRALKVTSQMTTLGRSPRRTTALFTMRSLRCVCGRLASLTVKATRNFSFACVFLYTFSLCFVCVFVFCSLGHFVFALSKSLLSSLHSSSKPRDWLERTPPK